MSLFAASMASNSPIQLGGPARPICPQCPTSYGVNYAVMSSETFSLSPYPSNQPGAMELVEFSSSPAASLPTTPSPRPRGTAADFIKIDWTLWGRQEWAKWPGFERYMGGQDTRAWWQQYGYRVEDHSTHRQVNKLKWICADCFARGFKKKSDFCFVCSTGVSVKKHLREAHGIVVSPLAQGSMPC